uniref:Aspergillus nuclease S(1) n=1 Tax=Odontella aurita TaxID=265563 RepID=A0A7S4MKC8_9STRA
MTTLLLAIVPVALLNRPVVTTAWGKYGHEIIGNIAYRRLSPKSKNTVDSILGVDEVVTSSIGGAAEDPKPDPLHDETPLAAIANWADKVRFTSEYHWTFQLHFVDVKDGDIDGGCPCTEPAVENFQYLLTGGENEVDDPPHYCVMRSASSCWVNYERDCKGDFCAIGAITNYTERLRKYSSMSTSKHDLLRGSKSSSAGLYTKEALMFLTHFVGDIHQPLHSSRGTDRGGNAIHVDFKDYHLYGGHHGLHIPRKDQWNLHAVWDDGIINRAISLMYNSSENAFEASVREVVTNAEVSGLIDDWLRCADGLAVECPLAWAEESLDDALRWAYSNENGIEITDGANITDAYFNTRLHVVRNRLAAAGVRLANAIEIVLGEKIVVPESRSSQYIVW